MSKIAVSSPSAGTATYTISAPAGSTDRTINLPDSNGTILTTATAGVPVNGPAFSANISGSQVLSPGVYTKINFDVAPSWGPAANGWDATNKRFKPTVAGYYMVSCALYASGGTGWANQSLVFLYLNGSADVRGQDASSSTYNLTANSLIYLNGTTDYLEIYAYSSGGTTVLSTSSITWVRGVLVRSAT